MERDKLDKGNQLVKEIKELRNILSNTKSQRCEWIIFTFGNGSNKETVCNDETHIEEIRDILIKSHELKLERLERKLKDL